MTKFENHEMVLVSLYKDVLVFWLKRYHITFEKYFFSEHKDDKCSLDF